MCCSMDAYFHLSISLDFLPLVTFPKPVASKKANHGGKVKRLRKNLLMGFGLEAMFLRRRQLSENETLAQNF